MCAIRLQMLSKLPYGICQYILKTKIGIAGWADLTFPICQRCLQHDSLYRFIFQFCVFVFTEVQQLPYK